jgi:hypothetical protein
MKCLPGYYPGRFPGNQDSYAASQFIRQALGGAQNFPRCGHDLTLKLIDVN